MRKISLITAIVMALTLMLASVALAAPSGNAACFGPGGDTETHGEHITRDYVNDADPTTPGVRGRAAHFDVGASPGTTFCNENGNADPGEVPALPPPLT